MNCKSSLTHSYMSAPGDQSLWEQHDHPPGGPALLSVTDLGGLELKDMLSDSWR